MKKLMNIVMLSTILFTGMNACAQDTEDKSKRPSPPAKVSQKIKDGATISIDYSQPSVKGRTIGKDLEPNDGEVWRTGANEATVFETDKNITVEGKSLPAGKYAFFTLFKGNDVTLIFSKTWKQWGAFKYSDADDALRVSTKYTEASSATEKMTFKISPAGVVTLLWGNRELSFTVK